MRKVVKVPLAMERTQTIELPEKSLFLTIQMHRDGPRLVADINRDNPNRTYTIEMDGISIDFIGHHKRNFIDSFEIGDFTFRVYVRDDDHA